MTATATTKTNRPSRNYSPELRERAIRMVTEHQKEYATQWLAIRSIAEKVGCCAETLRAWVKRDEIDNGLKPGITSSEREELKRLQRENRELKQANDILRKASAFFAKAEFDRLYPK